MDDKFELSESQQDLLKKKMGIDDLSKVKIVFEVESNATKGVAQEFTNSSSKFSFMICPCPGGGWSWLCC